ncbi:MAG: 30S ribosomal protein S16 [Alphaproteobacteria bacterium]|nr:30S ribosomal protein S16 [Alphaproteobacteria bacterium]MBP9877623.1 30S ribosomal protein S16 [Alphaproteobacteria bacterium]
MALKIRLARAGSKKRPFYHIVVADARSPRDGRFVEKIGSYNPMLAKESEQRVVVDIERAKHWISTGAQATDRVAVFLGKAGVISMPEVRNSPKKSQPKAKAQERLREIEEARKEQEAAAIAAKEAEKAAKEAPAPVEEAVVEEAAPEAPAEEAPVEEVAAEAEAPAEEATA